MAKQTPDMTQIIFIRLNDNGQDVDYTTPLNGPFDVTNLLQAMVVEASAKGKGIVVTTQITNLQDFFGVPPEGDTENASQSDQ